MRFIMSAPIKLIIDTDPGIDDAMAIHLAFADKRFDVLALTSIFGNVHTTTATRNALYLAEMAAYPCRVAAGLGVPMVQAQHPVADFVHGEEGFGHLPAVNPKGKAMRETAAEFMIKLAQEHPNEIIICALGPLTNLAAAVKLNPNFPKMIKKLVIMGGAVKADGNVTKYAEANIWNDPDAADLVFAQDWDMELIGLDVTAKIKCTPEDFAWLAQQAPYIGGFLNEAADFYFDFYKQQYGTRMCMMHDPSAILSIVEPELFSYEPIALRVVVESDYDKDSKDYERIGQTMADDIKRMKPRNKVLVALETDAAKVRRHYLDLSAQADIIYQARLGAKRG